MKGVAKWVDVSVNWLEAGAAVFAPIGLVLASAGKPETEAQRKVISALPIGKSKQLRARKVAA
jgi:hypothetical protein